MSPGIKVISSFASLPPTAIQRWSFCLRLVYSRQTCPRILATQTTFSQYICMYIPESTPISANNRLAYLHVRRCFFILPKHRVHVQFTVGYQSKLNRTCNHISSRSSSEEEDDTADRAVHRERAEASLAHSTHLPTKHLDETRYRDSCQHV